MTKRVRVLLLGTAAALLCATALTTWLLARDEVAEPPPLTQHMLAVIDQQGWHVVPDEAATARAGDRARELAERYAGTDPDRVVGVSLATVTDTRGRGTRERLLWVVYVEGVTTQCYGGFGCGPPGVGTDVSLIDPQTLRSVESTVF